MGERLTTADVTRKVREAGPNAWFRPMRILNDEFRYYGILTHKSAGTLGAMLDLHARGYIARDGSEHGIDLISINEHGYDLHDTLPLTREGMRFLRRHWRLRIDRPRRFHPAPPAEGGE